MCTAQTKTGVLQKATAVRSVDMDFHTLSKPIKLKYLPRYERTEQFFFSLLTSVTEKAA